MQNLGSESTEPSKPNVVLIVQSRKDTVNGTLNDIEWEQHPDAKKKLDPKANNIRPPAIISSVSAQPKRRKQVPVANDDCCSAIVDFQNGAESACKHTRS